MCANIADAEDAQLFYIFNNFYIHRVEFEHIVHVVQIEQFEFIACFEFVIR